MCTDSRTYLDLPSESIRTLLKQFSETLHLDQLFASCRAPVQMVPEWHRVPGTSFIVDKFGRDIENAGTCMSWFLTHFHADHYKGLNGRFKSGEALLFNPAHKFCLAESMVSGQICRQACIWTEASCGTLQKCVRVCLRSSGSRPTCSLGYERGMKPERAPLKLARTRQMLHHGLPVDFSLKTEHRRHSVPRRYRDRKQTLINLPSLQALYTALRSLQPCAPQG